MSLSNRRRILCIDMREFSDILFGIKKVQLPYSYEGAECLFTMVLIDCNCFGMVYQSEHFDEVELGAQYPRDILIAEEARWK